MTTNKTTKTEELTEQQRQSINKFQQSYFDKNKINLNLTLDEYHAIINVIALAKGNECFYVLRDLLDKGDPQKEALINNYNKELDVFKANGCKVRTRVAAGSSAKAPALVKSAKKSANA